MSVDAMAIPAELRARPNWVVWRREERDGKPTKVPYRCDGAGRASPTDPATWCPFVAAVAAAKRLSADGIGYVFSADDPYTGADLDDCIIDGELHPAAAAVILGLDSYSEISPSGAGVKVIVRADLNGFPRNRTSKTGWGGKFEVYVDARYFTITGRRVTGTPATIEERQIGLNDVLEFVFGPVDGVRPALRAAATAAVSLDDSDLLDRAMHARNGAKFEQLWRGDTSRYGSSSEADLALCSLLAYRTGRDPVRIDRLFRLSGLYREKWNRGNYREATIAKGIDGCLATYAAAASRVPQLRGGLHSPSPPVGEAAGVGARPPWLLDAAALLAEPDPGPTSWLVENLIVDQALVACVGRWKTTKSYCLLDVCIAVATGRPAFAALAVPRPGPVVFINEESGKAALWRRLDALCRGRAIDAEELRDRLYVAANARVRLDDLGWQKELLAIGEDLRPRLICFDPLARMKAPEREENSQSGMATLIEFVRELREASASAVAFVHHSGHTGAHMRGSSDLESAWETRLAWERKGESPVVTIKSGHREIESGGDVSYRIVWDGDTRTIRFEIEKPEREREIEKYLLEHSEASGNEVFKAVGGNRGEVLALVKKLRDQGGTKDVVPAEYQPVAGTPAGGTAGTPYRGAGTTTAEPGTEQREPPFLDEIEA